MAAASVSLLMRQRLVEQHLDLALSAELVLLGEPSDGATAAAEGPLEGLLMVALVVLDTLAVEVVVVVLQTERQLQLFAVVPVAQVATASYISCLFRSLYGRTSVLMERNCLG